MLERKMWKQINGEGGGGEREENKGIQGSNLLNRQYKGIEYVRDMRIKASLNGSM